MGLKIGLVSLYIFENNGIRILAAALRKAGFEVHEIYFKDYIHHRFIPPTDEEIALLKGVLRDAGVRLVGLSIRAGAYLGVGRKLTAMIRDELGLRVAWGGPHVTFDREKCAAECDWLAVGEAEESFVELARAIESGGDTTHIPGLWANVGGEIVRNPLRPLIEDLDRIPFRDYHSHAFKHVIDGRRHTLGDPVVGEASYIMLASRGCVFDCYYCDTNVLRGLYKGLGQYYRVRSVDNVLAEVEYARTCFRKMTRVRFDDELFPFEAAWVDEFARRWRTEAALPFDILSDPRVITAPYIRTLKGAGLDLVLLGIQSAEDVNRRLFGRVQSDAKVIEVSRILHEERVRAGFQIILDVPTTTTADSEALLGLLLKLRRPFDLYSFSLNLWPGTELTRRLLAKGAATESQVAGASDKVLHQFRVDAGLARPPEERLFIALYHLTSKSFVPRGLIRAMSRSDFLRRHPWPASFLSEAANFFKLGLTALRMIRRRELTWSMVRRFFNLKSPVSI